MTKQETFDFAVGALRKQGEKSIIGKYTGKDLPQSLGSFTHHRRRK